MKKMSFLLFIGYLIVASTMGLEIWVIGSNPEINQKLQEFQKLSVFNFVPRYYSNLPYPSNPNEYPNLTDTILLFTELPALEATTKFQNNINILSIYLKKDKELAFRGNSMVGVINWQHLWDGLLGQADLDKDQQITRNELYDFLRGQRPKTSYSITSQNFSIADLSKISLPTSTTFLPILSLQSPSYEQKFSENKVEIKGSISAIPNSFWLIQANTSNQYNLKSYLRYESGQIVFSLFIGLMSPGQNILEFEINGSKIRSIPIFFEQPQEVSYSISNITPQNNSSWESNQVTIRGSLAPASQLPQNFFIKFGSESLAITKIDRGNFEVVVPLKAGDNIFEFYANSQKIYTLNLKGNQASAPISLSIPKLTIIPYPLVIKTGKTIVFKIESSSYSDKDFFIRANLGTASNLSYTAPYQECEAKIQFYLYPNTFVKEIKIKVVNVHEDRVLAKTQMQAIAEEEAFLDAKIQLAEKIYGASIESATEVKDGITEKDTITLSIFGRLTGVRKSNTTWNAEDHVQVTATMSKRFVQRLLRDIFPNNNALVQHILKNLPESVEAVGEAYISY